jgi:hypothetical protein
VDDAGKPEEVPARRRSELLVTEVSLGVRPGRGRRTGGRRYDVHRPIDDHFLSKYRALLDAEDLAFDELEHACEEGDRTQFDKDMIDWQNALEHKLVFLANAGIELKRPVLG